MTNLQANVPLVSVPFVDKNGNVTEAWFIFLIQLWRRTGSGGGGNGQLTVADVLALEETYAGVSVSDTGSPLSSEVTFSQPQTQTVLQDMVFAPIAAAVVANETFSSGADFTPGATTVLSLKETFAQASQLWVFFDAAFQGEDQYSLSGTTLTFTGAIPVGTNKVYVKGLR